MEGKDIATVTFEDGHAAKFWGFRKEGYDQHEGLHRFSLYMGETQVVQYDARLRHISGREDEYRFIQLAEGYSPERVVLYWEAAADYLEKEYMRKRKPPEELYLPWVLCCKYGWSDLQHIKEGRAPLP